MFGGDFQLQDVQVTMAASPIEALNRTVFSKVPLVNLLFSRDIFRCKRVPRSVLGARKIRGIYPRGMGRLMGHLDGPSKPP